jgi:hypothetical protein
MHTTVAYRRPAWRCDSCGVRCHCLAQHRDCGHQVRLFGHHPAVLTRDPLDIDQLQQDGAQEARPRMAGELPGE